MGPEKKKKEKKKKVREEKRRERRKQRERKREREKERPRCVFWFFIVLLFSEMRTLFICKERKENRRRTDFRIVIGVMGVVAAVAAAFFLSSRNRCEKKKTTTSSDKEQRKSYFRVRRTSLASLSSLCSSLRTHTPPLPPPPLPLGRFYENGAVKPRKRTADLLSQQLDERERSRAMLVAPNSGDTIGGGGGGAAAGGGGGNATTTTTSTHQHHHPNPGGLRRQSKTEIADAFVRSLRERGGLDVDAPGVAASIRSHFQLLPSR